MCMSISEGHYWNDREPDTTSCSSSSMGSVSWAPKFKLSPTPSYKISKAALHMLNAQYALDHAEAGFTFLCVSPGVSMRFHRTFSFSD